MLEVINLITVENPFDPRHRETCELTAVAGQPISEYISHLDGDYVISINGRVLDNDTDIPMPGDCIVAFPAVHGGDDNKSIMRALVMIVASGYIAGLELGLLETAALTIGSGLVVNALMPLPTADTGTNLADNDTLSTYGLDGPKNISAEEVPVPICYGKFRMGGNLINAYVKNFPSISPDVPDVQRMYLLFNAGEGEVADITDIEINDQNLNLYGSAESQLRYGTSDQEFIDWFDDTLTPQNLSLPVDNVTWINHTTDGTVDKFRVDIVFPAGLVKIKDDGDWRSYAVTFEIQYRISGSADAWSSIGSSPTISAKSTSAVRRSFTSPLLDNQIWDIRVRRTTAEQTSDIQINDSCVVSDIVEILTNDINYRYTALVGIGIDIDDSISGLPRATYLNHGVKIKTYDGSSWSAPIENNNPAWIAWDALTNGRYGGGLDESRLDLIAWKQWADECTAKGREFNGVIDGTSMNLWDASKMIFRAGHAQIVPIGSKFSVVVENVTSPTMLFSVANILKGSFANTWIPAQDRANVIDLTYYDEDDKYKSHTLRVYDEVAHAKGLPSREFSAQAYGLTNAQKVFDEAVFILNSNKYINQTVKFDAAIEAIACTVGDVIYVQHDMPEWGYSGKIEVGSSSNYINLDRTVDIDVAKSYKFLVVYPSIVVGAGAISGKSGSILQFNSISRAQDISRIMINGTLDLEVVSYAPSGNLTYVEVSSSDAALVNVSDSFELYCTDCIEESDVAVTQTETVSSIVVSSAFSSPPAQYQNWLFGETTKVKKPFRVRSITGEGQYTRTIGAIEYNESLYDDNPDVVPTPNYSTAGRVSQVTDITMDEALAIHSGTIKVRVVVGWTPPSYGDSYTKADVYVATNGGDHSKIGEGYESFEFYANEADELEVVIVGINSIGLRAPYSSAPSLEYTVLGKAKPPENIPALNYKVEGENVTLYWDPVPDIDLRHYQIKRLNSFWSNGFESFEYDNWQDGAYDTGESYLTLEQGDVYRGLSAGRISTVSKDTGDAGGFAGGVYVEIPTEIATLFHDTVVVVSAFVKTDSGATEFEMAYSTNEVGNSTWQSFTPTDEWVEYSFTYAVAAGAGNSDYVGIQAGAGENILLDRITVKAEGVVDTHLAYSDATEFTLTGLVTGVNPFSVIAIDTTQNESLVPTVVSVNVDAPGTPSIFNEFIRGSAVLTWTASPGTFAIDHFDLHYGVDFETGIQVAQVSTDKFQEKADWRGVRTYWIAAVDVHGNVGVAGSIDAEVLLPGAPVLTSEVIGENLKLAWTLPSATLPILSYDIRYGGTDYASATQLTITDAKTYTVKVDWVGTRKFWIAALDLSSVQDDVSTYGASSSTDALIEGPGSNIILPQVIDNNVLLRWTTSAGTLPIIHSELRKGDSYVTAEIIGTSDSLFATIFESVSDDYTYWITAVDSAGNEGTHSSVTVLVSEPPDYILFAQYIDDFITGSPTKTNILVDGEGFMLMPVDLTETWSEHFITNNGPWASPQDQIDAGLPIYIQPSLTSAQYERVIDYGTLLTNLSITLNVGVDVLGGTPTLTPTIAISTDGSTYTPFVGAYKVFASSFRYVKITLDVTAPADADLLRVKDLSVVIDVKEKSDSGKGTALSTDSGGTTVLFTKDFIDVSSIVVSPKGTSPVTAIYDFVDIPEPTSFKVLLFNSAGARVTGDFSWNARGR